MRGVVARACAGNFVPNSWGVLRYLGLANRNRVLVSEDPNIVPADLAYAIQTTEDEIRLRRYEPLDARHVSFFGTRMHTARIETNVRRFSPTSLADRPVHLALWELRDIPFCLHGWDLLQDRCHCEGENGVVQGWTRTLAPVECCDRCGEPLSALEPHPVPEDMQEDLSLLLRLVGTSEEERAKGCALPPALAVADRGRIYEVIVGVTNALLGDRASDGDEPNFDMVACTAMHAACRAVRMWPSGLDDLEPAPDVTFYTWRRLGSAYRSLGTDRTTSKQTRSPLWRDDNLIGIHLAAKEGRMSPDTLIGFWKAGAVTPHQKPFGDRMMPAFDRTELSTLAEGWHDGIEVQAFASRHGLSFHGVEQLIVSNVLAATAPSLPDAAPRISSAGAADFLSRVETRACPAVRDPVSLRYAMLSVGGRQKPWGPIFGALLTGKVDYMLQDGDALLVDRIRVPRSLAKRFGDLHFDRASFPHFRFSPSMVQREALATLNISATGTRVLKGLPVSGRTTQLYQVADVEQRAREIITLSEIAFAMEVTVSQALCRIRKAGWEPTMPGAWSRREAERELHRL